MSQAFSNNDNSLNTIGSLNNNQNCFNEYDNCYNTTNVNNTTVDDRSEILAWLSPLEPRVRHRDIVARRIDGIGAWLLETEEFNRWQNGSREDAPYCPTLFCDGDGSRSGKELYRVREHGTYCCGDSKNTSANWWR